MRRRWQIAELRAALKRRWRVRPAALSRQELAGRLELHPLEERRVLSAGAAVALARALASSGPEHAQGTGKGPDGATPLGTDATHERSTASDKQDTDGKSGQQDAPQTNTDKPASDATAQTTIKTAPPPTPTTASR